MRIESASWKLLRPHLMAAKLDPIRVENPIYPGTPDVNLATGAWIELKAIEAYPKRPATNVRLDHFTPQQRVFLVQRWRAKPGSTYVVVRIVVSGFWLLFDGPVAAAVLGRCPAQTLHEKARLITDNPETIAEFFRAAA